MGAFTLPLSDWLKKCYIEERLIKPFEEIHEKMNGNANEVAVAASKRIVVNEKDNKTQGNLSYSNQLDILQDESNLRLRKCSEYGKGKVRKQPVIAPTDDSFEDDLFCVEDEATQLESVALLVSGKY